ncbi:MAG: DNA polymerase III subunit chi [Burkholderiales bacterium]|nr:DNA polymerase III subunit chi [Burkholderiales bacterium]
MTQVDFYLNVDDKLLFACRITAQAVAKKLPVLIYTAGAGEAAAVDGLLWSTQPLNFIPHCAPADRLAPETPVIIAHQPHDFHHQQVLVNLQVEWPPFFSRFERLVEIVSNDEADKAAARTRWKFYKDRGYPVQSHDMSRK